MTSHHLEPISVTTTSPDSADILKKKYEEMSFEEMSQRMAESNRQLSELLTTSMSSSHSASTLDTIATHDEEEQVIDEEDPVKKYNVLFNRAASNGDIAKVKEMLSDKEIRSYIDINARDSDGTPPLIYAACFGKTEIAKILLDYGALVDIQDNCRYYFVTQE
jgi:ankyrin repeat protein